ncbi:MAG: DUF6107 family protein [Allorhizobium sp.]
MADFSPDPGLWGARVVGSLAGSAISLVYLLPKGRREAAIRFVTGVAIGLIFGRPAGLWLAGTLDLLPGLTAGEILLSGSAAASLSAWWALGFLARLAERFGGRSGP